MRLVIDTNILIAHAYQPESASGRIVSACLEGWHTPVVSPALLDEYHYILPRAIRRPGWRMAFERFLLFTVLVEPVETPEVVDIDPSDDMLFAAAVTGDASVIITNDEEVLRVASYRDILVKTPRAFLRSEGIPL